MYFEYERLLEPPVARAAYSDRTAWLMAEMSRLAYAKFELHAEKLEELKNALKRADFELVDTFDNEGTQAFLAKRDKDKMLVLAFRGTEKEDLRDIITDLDARFYKDEHGGRIHNGFLEAFKKVEVAITKQIEKLNTYFLYITGHSLGGALALIATREFNSDNLAACYTFGSPKVGNSEFGDIIKPPIYRIVNALDVVPCLPFSYFLDIFYYLFRLLKISPLQKFVQKFRGYDHHGDMRFLTPCKVNYKQLRVIQNYNEIKRSFRLLKNTLSDRKIGIKCHSVDDYCEKLGQYGLKRLEVK